MISSLLWTLGTLASVLILYDYISNHMSCMAYSLYSQINMLW